MAREKDKTYRPSDREPFMNERQREYFRNKLLVGKEDILKEAQETLQHLQDENQNHPDLADRASSETEDRPNESTTYQTHPGHSNSLTKCRQFSASSIQGHFVVRREASRRYSPVGHPEPQRRISVHWPGPAQERDPSLRLRMTDCQAG